MVGCVHRRLNRQDHAHALRPGRERVSEQGEGGGFKLARVRKDALIGRAVAAAVPPRRTTAAKIFGNL